MNYIFIYCVVITTGKSKGQRLIEYLPNKFPVNLEKQNF